MSVFTPPQNCVEAANNIKGIKYKPNSNFKFSLATEEEVFQIINSLKSNAMGIDGISAYMIKLCCPNIVQPITHIINCCLETGYFPELWKVALIHPIPKIDEVNSPEDLRPISILPTLSKVLEKCIYNQIFNFIVKEEILSEDQSGFRKGYSTTTALASVIDDCLIELDKNHASIVTLLDYSKAFDTLDHHLLCTKLEYYGFDQISVSFFKSYLQNRHQQVVTESGKSKIGLITSGVPQGSVLGPILFTIYTSQLLQIPSVSKKRAFADDTQMQHHFLPNEVDIASNHINNDLQNIANVSSDINLQLNINKCKVICFAPRKFKNVLFDNINIKFANIKLPVLHTVRNLGLVIDDDFRFKTHISNIIKKSYVALKLLYSNYLLLNFKLRKKLCESLILSCHI